MIWGFILLLLCLLVILCFPVRKTIWQKNIRQKQNIALYQQQIANNSDADLAYELSQRLLKESQTFPTQVDFLLQNRKSAVLSFTKSALTLSTLIALISTVYYVASHRYEQAKQGERLTLQQQMEMMNKAMSQHNEDQIYHLQQQLTGDPNRAEDWFALAQAYVENNEFENALIAYNNVEKLMGEKAHILSAKATALYLQAEQQLTPQSQHFLQQALALDPLDSSSLSLLAAEAFKQKDYVTAKTLWQQILDSQRPNIDRRIIIQRMQMAEMLQK